ncbi:MAG: AraC family transcriptional regulator [Xanthomonadales bacterium]|nr:AraC family transcriptional regulator [Xanthomonadales bacterium]
MQAVHTSRHASNEQLDVHRHAAANAALVLEGGFTESSVDGRFECRPGTLAIRPPWHLHADLFGGHLTTVINITLPLSDAYRMVQVSDVDGLVRLIRRHPQQAIHAVQEEAESVTAIAPADWVARLSAMLACDAGLDIASIAQHCGVSTDHAIRTCKRWFGLSPAALRRERRLQRAITMLRDGAAPVEVAALTGFSDQPHMTRLLKRATGLTPAAMSRH